MAKQWRLKKFPRHNFDHHTARNECGATSSHEHPNTAMSDGTLGGQAPGLDRTTTIKNHFPSVSGVDAITSTQRALGVSEILEHILLRLPFLDLFNAQRVSGRWNELIARSAAIQQRMFLRPVEAPMLPLAGLPAYSDHSWPSPQHDLNISLSPCQTVFITQTLAINPVAYLCPSRHEEGPRAWVTNTWPGSRQPILRLETEAKRLGWTKTSPDYTRFDFTKLSMPAKDRVDAAWRKTLVTQPPITAVEFFSQDVREGNPEHYRMSNPTGVTLGDLQEWEELFTRKHGLGFEGRCIGHFAACGFWIKRPDTA